MRMLLTVDTATLAPPKGAFLLIWMMHMTEDKGARVVCAQESPETMIDPPKVIVVFAEVLL